jgi:hypothetical protein
MSARQKDLLRQIEYPETDGEPLAETDKHRKLINALIETLDTYFASEPEVWCSSANTLISKRLKFGRQEFSVGPHMVSQARCQARSSWWPLTLKQTNLGFFRCW